MKRVYNCALAKGRWLVLGLMLVHAMSGAMTEKPRLDERYGKLPLSFEENQGQSDKQVRFLSRGSGYSLFLTDDQAVFVLGKDQAKSVVRMRLEGTRSGPHVSAESQMPGTVNYFIGSDSAKWHSAVATYRKVKYSSVYDGVDLLYYGNQRQLEYDFVVAPYADTKQIRLRFDEARRVLVERNGDLRIVERKGEIAFHKPVVYQELNGRRTTVKGHFRLIGKNVVGFAIGDYDQTKALVIDPTLAYSTLLGGTTTNGAGTKAVAVDAAGNAYVVGTTSSTDFPVTPGAFQTVNRSDGSLVYNAFVTKLDPTGSKLIYSTYLGGSKSSVPAGVGVSNNGDTPYALSVDSAGDAYVAGATTSIDFPVTAGAFQTVNKAGITANKNGFVTKLNSSGTQLIYSTYLGGTKGDGCSNIAIDQTGNAYVTGEATSADFPVTGGVLQINNKAAAASGANAFVTKLNTAGSALIFSTYLGGSTGDIGTGIAVDSGRNVYVGGASISKDFPVTVGAFQTVNQGAANGFSNGFVAKLKPDGSSVLYATYLGGTGNVSASSDDASADNNDGGDIIESLFADAGGNVYVSGVTLSGDFPVTPGAFQTVNKSFGVHNASNRFVSKLDASGTSLIYSTYLGGSWATLADGTQSMAVDANGNVYLTGATFGSDFPVTGNAFQSTNNCPKIAAPNYGNMLVQEFNAFLTELDSSGSSLVYSTYLGGSGITVTLGPVTLTSCVDNGYGVAVDSTGGVYVVGNALSPDFPTTAGAFETSKTTASGAAFVTKFALGNSSTSVPVTTLNADVNPQNAGSPVTFTALVKSSNGGIIPTGNVIFTIDGGNPSTVPLDPTGHATYSTSTLTAGNHTIGAVYSGDSTYSTSNGSFVETIIGTVTLSFNTSPSGLAYSVDGTTYTTGQSLTFALGSQHTVSVSSPQTLSSIPYTFSSWSDGGAPTHAIVASANAVYTASFAPSGSSALFGNITSKTGNTDSRIWNVQITNGGTGLAMSAAVSSFAITQTGGATCSPLVTSLLPAIAGDLAPGATATIPVAIDFTGCAALARFTVTVSLSANGGSNSASIVRLNQFR